MNNTNSCTLTDKQWNRIGRVKKLDENHPREYCWSSLYDMAVCVDRNERLDLKDDARDLHLCRYDYKRNGNCWCGKFCHLNPIPEVTENDTSKS